MSPTASALHRVSVPPRAAFTLLEVLIVVVLIGLLAAITLPNVSLSVSKTRETTVVRTLNVLQVAVQTFHARTSDYPLQANPGEIPTDFRPYLPAGAWTSETPLGGLWDIDRGDAGVTFAIGIHYGSTTPPIDRLAIVDTMIDDGNLATGRFRQFGANRFYHVMEE